MYRCISPTADNQDASYRGAFLSIENNRIAVGGCTCLSARVPTDQKVIFRISAAVATVEVVDSDV